MDPRHLLPDTLGAGFGVQHCTRGDHHPVHKQARRTNHTTTRTHATASASTTPTLQTDTQTDTHAHTHTHTHTHAHAHAHTHTHIHTRARARAHTHTPHTHTVLHTVLHTHTHTLKHTVSWRQAALGKQPYFTDRVVFKTICHACILIIFYQRSLCYYHLQVLGRARAALAFAVAGAWRHASPCRCCWTGAHSLG